MHASLRDQADLFADTLPRRAALGSVALALGADMPFDWMETACTLLGALALAHVPGTAAGSLTDTWAEGQEGLQELLSRPMMGAEFDAMQTWALGFIHRTAAATNSGGTRTFEHEGWLMKRGHASDKDAKYKRRFFVLNGLKLKYYDEKGAEGGAKPLKELCLRDCVVEHAEREESRMSLAFKLKPVADPENSDKTYFMAASSPAERDSWVSIIRQAVKHAQVLMTELFEGTKQVGPMRTSNNMLNRVLPGLVGHSMSVPPSLFEGQGFFFVRRGKSTRRMLKWFVLEDGLASFYNRDVFTKRGWLKKKVRGGRPGAKKEKRHWFVLRDNTLVQIKANEDPCVDCARACTRATAH